MLSFWEQQSFVKYDYVIIGGGIVGLSTAISIKEAERDATVLVLERGLFPSGASTKNAGFACFGSLTEILTDIGTIGEKAALALVKERWLGLKMLRKRLGDDAIDFQNFGGYELITAKEQKHLCQVDRLNNLLEPVFGDKAFVDRPELVATFKFSSDFIKSIVFNPYEGQIDTGKMMRSLIDYAYSLGVGVYTGATVERIIEEGDKVSVLVRNSIFGDTIKIIAGKTAVCTNAFAKDLIPDLEIVPGRGIVVVTQPLPSLPFKGVFHMEEGFYYFRNFNDRVIFGGGRNIDFKAETTTKFEINEKILSLLKKKLSQLILPGTPHEIDSVWSGIMAFGPNKQPVVEFISPNVVAGVGLGGMGIAIGSKVGEQLSQMILD